MVCRSIYRLSRLLDGKIWSSHTNPADLRAISMGKNFMKPMLRSMFFQSHKQPLTVIGGTMEFLRQHECLQPTKMSGIYNHAVQVRKCSHFILTDFPSELTIYTAIELGFLTQSNETYQIQASPDLFTWTNYDSQIQGTGSNWFKTYSIRGQPHSFYRIGVVQ